jgi:hypothetical protein
MGSQRRRRATRTAKKRIHGSSLSDFEGRNVKLMAIAKKLIGDLRSDGR